MVGIVRIHGVAPNKRERKRESHVSVVHANYQQRLWRGESAETSHIPAKGRGAGELVGFIAKRRQFSWFDSVPVSKGGGNLCIKHQDSSVPCRMAYNPGDPGDSASLELPRARKDLDAIGISKGDKRNVRLLPWDLAVVPARTVSPVPLRSTQPRAVRTALGLISVPPQRTYPSFSRATINEVSPLAATAMPPVTGDLGLGWSVAVEMAGRTRTRKRIICIGIQESCGFVTREGGGTPPCDAI